MTTNPTNEKTPDDLLRHFHGRSLKGIIIFTVVLHALVLLGSSVPYLWKTFAKDTAGLSEEERFKLAAKEADAALRAIAEEHGIKPQDLGDRLADGGPKTTAPAPAPTPAPTGATPATPAAAPGAAPAPTGEPAAPPSAIEKEIQKVEPGPTVPGIPSDDDLFK